jgi:hypothetical protein
MAPLCDGRHRFPPEIIQHAIWLHLQFTLTYRDVEELLAERGLDLFLRDGAPLGVEVRPFDQRDGFAGVASAERPMAFGRDGGADRQYADVALARRRP